MRVLEVGDLEYLHAIRPDVVDYFYIGKKTTAPLPLLTRPEFKELRRLLQSGHYDCVVLSVFATSSAVWRRNRSFVSCLLRVLKCQTSFYTLGPEVVLWLLHDLDTPLIVLDRKDDPDKIPPHFFKILERCRKYFWREHPIKIEHGFTFTTGYLEDTSAVRNFSVFKHNRDKIEPLSLGVRWSEIYEKTPDAAKIYDVFFAGTVKGSQIRADGARLLEELRSEGVNVLYEEGKVYSFEEYIGLCAQSRLVWSPEGHGWDCFRHYEIALASSIPVTNYPRIRRYQPLIDREHAFYYGVEGDDLKRVIKSALALGPDELKRISAQAREHVRAYHLTEKIFAHVLETSGIALG